MECYAAFMARVQVRSGDRHRTPSTEVSDSLLAAALELLEERGSDALTVRAVASRAGVAPMGVYSRYGGKPGLVEALFVHGFTGMQEAIASAGGSDSFARLGRGCRAYRSFAIDHPHLYQLMFQRMLDLDLSAESLEKAAGTFDHLAERVGDAMDAGLLSAGDPVAAAQEIWNGLHGGVMLEIAGITFTPDPERTFGDMLDTMLRGLASR